MVILRISVKLSGEGVLRRIGSPLVLDEGTFASLEALEKSQMEQNTGDAVTEQGSDDDKKKQDKSVEKSNLKATPAPALTKGVLDVRFLLFIFISFIVIIFYIFYFYFVYLENHQRC